MPAVRCHQPWVRAGGPRFFYVRRCVLVIAALLVSLTLTGTPAYAEVYRWVDSQGRVHFGDKPPDKEGATSVDIKPHASPSQPAPNAAQRRDKQQRLLRAWEQERREREEKAAEAKEERERRERNCNVAKDRLRTYRNAATLYDLDANGKRRTLGNAEHKAALKDAEDAVEYWCG